jgi:sugar-specific transcriptional regulator TrmB
LFRSDTILQRIKDLGFTAYEAKTYVTLLKHHPLTRYELSKLSGVPRSAIYNVIHKLEEIGAVSSVSAKPEKYIPLPPDKLFDLLEHQFFNRIKSAQDILQDFEMDMEPDHLWNILGYENLIIKCKELIRQAKNTLYLSIWKREFEMLKMEISEASQRGVKIIIHSFTDLEKLNRIELFCYQLEETELEKFWTHKLILIIDKSEILMGEADTVQPKKAVWTNNRSMIDIALNHIILDITIFGIRVQQDVNTTVESMQNGETDYLGKLLKERHPNIDY